MATFISRRERQIKETPKLQRKDLINENDISYKVIGAAIELHKNIGPGLLESAYENALAYDLREIGFNTRQQVPMPFFYKDVKQEIGYRLDLLVNNL